MLGDLLTIDDLHREIGVEHVSRRTLDNIVRDLGYRKGRGRRRTFTLDQALVVQEQVICQRVTHQDRARTIVIGSSVDGLTEPKKKERSRAYETNAKQRKRGSNMLSSKSSNNAIILEG